MSFVHAFFHLFSFIVSHNAVMIRNTGAIRELYSFFRREMSAPHPGTSCFDWFHIARDAPHEEEHDKYPIHKITYSHKILLILFLLVDGAAYTNEY